MKKKLIRIKDIFVDIFSGVIVFVFLVSMAYFASNDDDYCSPDSPFYGEMSSLYEEMEEEGDRSMIEYLESKGYQISEPLALS
jgi:hypothetical protein